MKVVNIGEQSGNYGDLVLQAGKKRDKYGKLYFLKERIYLVQRKPVTDYNIWKSDKEEKHLRLCLTEELKRELDNIEKAAIFQIPGLVFKT